MKKKTNPNPRRRKSKGSPRPNPGSRRKAAGRPGEFLAKITITLRKSILDPQGKAVEHAIATMNVGMIKDVRMGKHIELKIDAKDEASARVAAEEVCRKLLANPVMEDFHVVLERV